MVILNPAAHAIVLRPHFNIIIPAQGDPAPRYTKVQWYNNIDSICVWLSVGSKQLSILYIFKPLFN